MSDMKINSSKNEVEVGNGMIENFKLKKMNQLMSLLKQLNK